jgi:hypothetical protein
MLIVIDYSAVASEGHPMRKSLDDTFGLATDPVVEAYKSGIDLTLLRENLKLTVEERILKLQELSRFADELHRAGRRARSQA